MALFLATHINKLDKKGRVSVPAAWRPALIQAEFAGVVLTPSYKTPLLDGFPYSHMARLSDSFDQFSFYSDDQTALATTLFAEAQPLNFDGDGRITLPDDLCAHANLTENVAFLGLGQFFQIWEPAALAAHRTAARARVLDNNLTATLGKGAPA